MHVPRGTQVTALLKNKGSLEQLEPIVAWDPAPVYVSGYTKLREGYAAAQVWVRRAAQVLQQTEPVHLKTLESLVSEASRIPISLPDAKVCARALHLPHISLLASVNVSFEEVHFPAGGPALMLCRGG
jgi:hypothetical protein